MFDLDTLEPSEALEQWRRVLAAELDGEGLAARLGVPVDLSGVHLGLDAAARNMATALSDDDLAGLLHGLDTARRSLDAAELSLLAELDQRGATVEDRGLRTGPWLAATAKISHSAARARVRLARDLHDRLPEVLAALVDGCIGVDHARVLLDAVTHRRAGTLIEPMVPDLLTDATVLGFDVWRAKIRQLVALLDADGTEPEDPTADNTVVFTRGLEGRWILHGEFDPVTGAAIRDAINARADSLFHARHRDEHTTGGTDLLTPSHRRLAAQALYDMARADRADRHPGAGPAAEITLHIDAADPLTSTDATGVRIGDTQHRTLTCDPLLRGVVFGLHRRVLDVGDLQRLVTAAQRRAMERRDGGCVFPGCDAPARWTDAHHVEHWVDGGPTDLANLASLCRHHHGVSHRNGWTMGATADEWFWWITPTGRFLWSQRHQIRRTGPPPPDAHPPRPAHHPG